ncbi:MAG: DUF1565 domain-containing protein, partial [Myxococcota bacterium]|nr:DUF1565 domain-containing protein [Myxococcota bacterium]
ICNSSDDDCDLSVDEDFTTAGVYDQMENCGSCGNDCNTQGFDNATPFCDASLTTPSCDFVCDDGFEDANGEPLDGCECVFISSIDDPFDGIDANCDGADGDHDDAIHVSVANGSDANDGSLGSPLSSVTEGLSQASAQGKTYVLVAEGSYTENITLPDGVILYGSMSESFDSRSVNPPTTSIIGLGGTPAVIAQNISQGAQIDGFSIEGHPSNSQSASAIGVYISDSTDALILTDNVIYSADAKDGLDGAVGGDGNTGIDG